MPKHFRPNMLENLTHILLFYLAHLSSQASLEPQAWLGLRAPQADPGQQTHWKLHWYQQQG